MKKILISILCLFMLSSCSSVPENGKVSYSAYTKMIQKLDALIEYDVLREGTDQVLMDETIQDFCALSTSRLEVTVYPSNNGDIVDGIHYEYYTITKENSFGYQVGTTYNIDDGTLQKGEASSQLYHYEDGLETIGNLTYDIESTHFTQGIIFSQEDIDVIEKDGNEWNITFKQDASSYMKIETNDEGYPVKISYDYGISSAVFTFSNLQK